MHFNNDEIPFDDGYAEQNIYSNLIDLANQEQPTQPFECAWCKDSGLWTKEEYTYKPELFGGWDGITKQPICDGCAESADQETLA